MTRRSATRLAAPRRTSRILMVVVLFVFINVPALHSEWQRWRIESSGVAVTGEVVQTEQMGEGWWVSFRYPEDVDAEGGEYPAQVDRETWEDARASGEIGVRYLDGQPSAYLVDGQQRHFAGVITTVVADVILLLILLLAWKFGGRRRPLPVRLAAIADVERCAPGALLEQVEGDLYLAQGEVTLIEDDEVWLDLGDQDVIVILDGHTNQVGYQQPAQVRGRLLP